MLLYIYILSNHLIGGGTMQYQRDFNQTIYIAINLLWKFFQANLYFWLCNPLLLLLILFVKTEVLLANLWLLIVPLMFSGPPLAALFGVMDQLIRQYDLPIRQHFFQTYRLHFRRSFLVWSLQVIIVSILLTDIYFFKGYTWGHYLLPLLFLPLFITITMNFYLLPITVKLHLGPKLVIKLAFYHSLKQWKTTLLLLGGTIALTVVFFAFPYFSLVGLFGCLFLSSLLAYLIMWCLRNLWPEISP